MSSFPSYGGTLEDCYTNIFALTEINGLQWKCFQTSSNVPRGIPTTSDPVLQSYSKCLKESIMCVWRRKPLSPSNNGETLPVPSLNGDIKKELWVFWYSEVPEKLADICSELDEDQEAGSEANTSNSVSYEVRVLYFKALHVLLERQMMQIGYVRFGRWFAKPQRGKRKEIHHTHYTSIIAMNFHFFVHGGNTICCAVKTQRQPTLIKLQKRHLEYDSMKRRISVLIGPWSLRGYLVRNQLTLLAEPRMASKAEKQFAEWKDFLQCDIEEDKDVEEEEDDEYFSVESEKDVPKMVLIEIDGIRMLVPSRYVCLTLDDERLVWDALGVKVTTVPEELAIPGGILPRNKFVTTAANAFAATKGGFESAMYDSVPRNPIQPIITSGGFAHPFPTVDENMLKWNFHDERHLNCKRPNCTMCKFMKRRELAGGKPLLDREEYTSVREELERKSVQKPDKRAYHRIRNAKTAKMIMIKEKQQQDAGPLPAQEFVHEYLWQANHHVFYDKPKWCQIATDNIQTGIYVNTEGSNNHHVFSSNTNSSDEEESTTWSPFTPIRAISPCTDCEWPAIPADQMTETVFNSIFHTNKTVRLPPNATQEDKSREFDSYYNPTLTSLRAIPEYAAYHNKRRGEKRKSTYPPNIRVPGDDELTSSSRLDNPMGSVEEPGSQDTIPAKSSPDEEVEDVREEDEEGVVKVVHVEKKQDERSKLLDYLNIKDEPMKRRRKKKQKKCLSVPDISLLEMALDNEPLKEEMGPQLENYPGRVSPAYSASPVYPQPSDEASSMFPEYADEKNENRALGEGTSVHFTDDSVMEVDSGPHEKSSSTSSSDQSTRLAETYGHDSILSPPASNEMARGGPPSVGDTMCPKGPPSVEASMAAAMNQIYPTPPSVQTELQQFSPATMMSQSLISTSIGSVPMVQTPLAFSAPFSVIQNTDEMMDFTCSTSSNSVADKKSQQKKEEVKEEETDDYDSYESIEKMKERVSNKEVVDLMSKISMGPLKSSQRKILMPPSKRFSGASQANAESITIRRVISTPPKYPKMLETARRAESKVGSRPGSATIIRNPKDAPLDMKEVAAVAAWHAQQPHQFTSGGQMSGYGGMPHPSHHNNMQQFQHQVPYPGMTPQQHYQYQQQQQQQMMMGQQQQHHMGGFQPSTPMNQHQMMGGGPGGPGYPPMGQYRQPGQYGPGMHMGMMQPPQQQQQQQMHQMYGQQMRNPMMGGPQGMNRGQLPPPYGAPSASGPGNYYGSQYGNYPAQTSVQQLNNFVNQPRFGGATPGPGMPGLGGGPPYGSMTGQHNQMNQFGSSPYSMDQQNQFNPMRQLPYSQQTPMGMGMQQQRMGMPLQMGPQSMGRTPTSSAIALNTPQHKEPQVPEGESVVLAIVLSDTILDLHYDSFLDACPICSCNVSIRARELGTYLTPHNSLRTGAYPNPRDHDTGNWSGFYVNGMQTQCTCGFSSIRHRYLSFAAGLFPEDSKEATALENSVMNVVTNIDGGYQAGVQSKNMTWFDSSSVADLALVDQIRQLAQVHSYGKAIGHMASLFEMAEKVTKASGISMDMTMATEYLVSEVDMMELQKIGHSAIDLSMQGLAINRNSSANTFLTYFHPWGLQNANEMRDPISLETKYALEVVTPALENAIRIARSISQPGGVNIVEGPLTWKQFVLKTQKSRNSAEPQEDDQYLAEPIPAVIAATERESIRAAPLIRQLAETTTLPPIDQPKDVLYLAIVPDSDVAVEKMARFMDRLSDHYERQRLGRHVAFPIQMHPDACRMHEQYIYQQQQRQQQEVADNQKMQKMMQEQMMNDPLMGGSSAMLGPSSSYQEPMETDSVQQPRDVAVDEATNPMVDTASAAPKWVQPSTTPLFMEPWPFDEEVPHRADTMEDVKNIPTNPAPFSEPARDGILRAGGKARIHSKYAAQNVANSIEFANMTRAVNDNYGFITRLKIFIQQFEDQVTALLVETPNVFERQTFRVQMAQEMKNKKCQQAAHAAFVKDKHSDQVDESRECGSTTPPPTGGKSVSPSEMATGDESSPLPPRSTSQPTLHDLLSEPSSTLSQSGGSQQQQQQSQQPTTSQVPRVPLMPEPLELEEIPYDEPGTLPHVIVLYVANPFTWGRENHSPLLMRVSIMAIVRTFNSILFKLPMKRRPQVQLEIIGLDQLEDHGLSVVDYLNDPRIPSDLTSRKGNTNYNDHICRDPPSQISPDYTPVEQIIKALSVAVYTHPRILNPDAYKSIQPRCMTSFGPGSSLLQTVEYLEAANRDAARMGKSFPYAFKVPSNIMYLAPPPYAYQKSENSKVLVSPSVEETALYVTYCLAGGDFLLATVTDGQGKLIDNCVINMKPRVEPNHTFKYKQRTQILDAMGRLWSFILGVMASDVKNWRLVVGRLGRIGHGEYRAWAHLLSKTSLQRYSTRLKEICLACNQMPGVLGTPAILSACLVTTEPEPNVRFFYDYVEKETNTKKSKQIVAPEDISCTHIVTFPVGAEINYDTQDASADDTKNEENWDFGDLDLGNDFEDGMKDIIKDVTETDTTELGSSSRVGMHSFFNDDANVDYQNQPLASGFYFSTAPAVDLPDWFWSSCPSRKRSIPVHLKSSLHINVPEIKNDDIMESAPNKDKDRPDQREPHPLESHQTEEVLRHVLETYNALSWLNVDPITGKRYSCLPIHMQHLLRLYHSIVRLLM